MTERKEIWIAKNGEVLDVDEMTEDHLRNTLKMLIKQIREGKLGCLGYHQERINMERSLMELREINDDNFNRGWEDTEEIHLSLTAGVGEYTEDGDILYCGR